MNAEHWANQQERGSTLALNITRKLVQYSPLWLIRVVTFVVVLYFYVTSYRGRQNIGRYYQHLAQYYPDRALPLGKVFRHFLAFGEAIVDRFAVWQHKIRYEDLLISDPDKLHEEMQQQGKGQILLCSHFGNVEICRALLDKGKLANFKLNVLVHSKHAQKFNQALMKAGASELAMIQVSQLDAATMLMLANRLECGEWIAIAADRVPIRGEKTAEVDFLGRKAPFPQGAWLLAALFKVPLNTLFCVKEKGQYQLKLQRFSNGIVERKNRHEEICQLMQRYADCLAQECYEKPQYWFNFYDFWNERE